VWPSAAFHHTFFSLSVSRSLSLCHVLSVSFPLSLSRLSSSFSRTNTNIRSRHPTHSTCLTITSTPARHTYNTLQHALQHTAALCNTLQRTDQNVRSRRPTHSTGLTTTATPARQTFNTLTATHFSTTHTATHCNNRNALQRTATLCNILVQSGPKPPQLAEADKQPHQHGTPTTHCNTH